MRYFNKLFIWENKKHLKILKDYRCDIVEYFKNVDYSYYSGPVENEKAIKLRQKINMESGAVLTALEVATVEPVITYSPPPAVGGLAGDINTVKNIFNLHNFQMSSQEVLDFVDQAIGIYKTDYFKSYLRTFNPFHWLTLLILEIIRIPFYILGAVGFNRAKIETSFIGRLSKGIAFLLGLLLTIVQLSEKFGVIDTIKKILSFS